MYDCSMLESFFPPFSQAAVDDLRSRLQQTRWPDTVIGAGTFLGVNRDFLIDLCRYWIDTFDWKSQLDRLAVISHKFQRFGEQRVRLRF